MTVYATKITEISKEHNPDLYWQISNEIKRFKKGANAIYRVYNKKPQAKKCYIIPKSSLKFDKENNIIIFPQSKLKIQIPFDFNWDDLKLLRIKEKLRSQKDKISLVFKHAINRTRAIRREYGGYVELLKGYKWKTYPVGSDAKFPSIPKIIRPIITKYNIEIKKLEMAIAKRKKWGYPLKDYFYLLVQLKNVRRNKKQLIKQALTKIAKTIGHIAFKENLFLVVDKTLEAHKTRYYYFTLLETLKREFTKRNLLVIHRRNREAIEPVSKEFLCDLLKQVEYDRVGRKLPTEQMDKLIYKFWQSGEKSVSNVFPFDSPEEKRIYSLQTYMEHMNLDPLKDIMYAWSADENGNLLPWAAGKGGDSCYRDTGKRLWHGPVEKGSNSELTPEEIDKALSEAMAHSTIDRHKGYM